MRLSFSILLFFVAGIILGHEKLIPAIFLDTNLSLYALWLLMACIGLSLGADKDMLKIFKSLNPAILFLPLATTLGTFAGAISVSFFLPYSMADCLAVGSGFAYYSLSSIFITQFKGADLGTLALIANIAREMFTLVSTPVLVYIFGPMAAISCGGATTMDTTLPIITCYAGNRWIMPAILHAMIIDFSVPFWVTLFCSI